MRQAVASALNLERGFLHTLLTELREPGRPAREVVQGRTVAWARPISFLLVGITVAQLVSMQFGVLEEFLAGFYEAYQDPGPPSGAAEFIVRWFVVLLGGSLPVLALVSRAVHHEARFNFAEHLVLHAYAFGTAAILFALLTALTHLLPAGPRDLAAAVFILGLVVQYVRSTRGFTGAGVLASSFTVLLSVGVGGALMGIILGSLR